MKRKFKRKGKHYVYILKCSDNTYYTGYTPDLEKRIKLHSDGKGAKYTRARLPVELAWNKEYKYFKKAFLTELVVKKLTRQKKESLVGGKRLDRVLAKAKKRRPAVRIPVKFYKNLPGAPRTRPQNKFAAR